jgi:thiol:disulfide interchange protein DsbD
MSLMRRLSRTVVGPMLTLAVLAFSTPARAQAGGEGAPVPPPGQLVRVSAETVRIAPGGTAEARLRLAIAGGWHINANPASPDYMIATTVALTSAGGVSAGTPRYPEAKQLKVAFDESAISAWDGGVEIDLPLSAASDAAVGARTLEGTLKFQSCNDHVCLPPATVRFSVPVSIAAGSPGAATPGATPTPAPTGGGFATAAPADGGRAGALDNPLARALTRGGWAALLALFVTGLLLNLTPCVFPMLGVTVSIFGARRATPGGASAPPYQVLGLAVVYVLGMASMYTALGVFAGLTGGLFGGALQSPWVQGGIGALLIVLSLSMFGLYQLQAPAWMLARLGGTGGTSVASVFGSGLVVGVIAAPCIGPPIVTLLAIVAAKGDAWFGFRSFFTLSLGLGAPYLVLATSSNLIQRLPRSGEWMIWVERAFGVVLLSLGLFYGMNALAPRLSGWVLPGALVLGGLYLGFVEQSASARPGFRRFKWAAGLLAVAAGVALVVTSPTRGIAFRPLVPAELERALASGRPVLLEFSADWCAPCHELERSTFSDPRVIAAAGSFAVFKVDLTHYDTPEAEQWRKQYGITGVPTVVFLAPGGGAGGTEVPGARVEGFIPPERFLERMRLAVSSGGVKG